MLSAQLRTTRSWAMPLLAMLCLAGVLLAAASAQAKVTKVLTVTGDWKSQAWYQDEWMQGKGQKLLRGRWMAKVVNDAAPGQFEFTDVTNYTGQEYLDANYMSQFDVVLLGDVVGWSFNPRFQQSVEQYVKNGGGLIFCGSWKWHCDMVKGTPFEAVLPAEFPVSNVTDDWGTIDNGTGDKDFKPIANKLDHPIMKGLDWNSVSTLGTNFKVLPRQGVDVLLKAPSGAPVFVAWNYGKGRAIMSTAIFANDDISEKFCNDWKDSGKFYAQTFAWLGGNSTNAKATLKAATADVAVNVNYAKPLNNISPALFSVHGAQDCPGFAPLQGQALEYFNALNPKGEFARMAANCEPARGKFDFTEVDHQISEINRLGMEPIALFSAYAYGKPDWLWADGSNWGKPSDQAVKDIVEEVSTFLTHFNGGKKGDATYKPNVKYVEICNEPGINGNTIDGYVKIFRAVAQNVHQNFPEVKVGGLGGYELPYVYWFIDKAGPDIDWISRHPYGWTGEMLFKLQDDFAAYARKKGYGHIKFIITEWDFWIQGRQKFDYMMKRNFEAVKREELLGTLHYRFGMYGEPIYLFGIMWGGWGQNQGAGPANTPMHDAYDAFWIFRDFRGQRVETAKTTTVNAQLLDHMLVDATRDGDKLNIILYYDWAYDGAGYKDYAKGLNYTKVNAKIKLALPAAAKDRVLTISRATGEGYEVLKKTVTVPAKQKEYTDSIEIDPLTAISISLQ